MLLHPLLQTILQINEKYFLKNELNVRKAKVLNYARKNKYPRNCITLTYWGNDYPSRLDLDKEKYSGSFTEEVENVKTVLCMIPLMIVVDQHTQECKLNILLYCIGYRFSLEIKLYIYN